MTSPLRETSLTYERSVEQVDQILLDRGANILSWDLQEIVELGLGLFDTYDRLDSRWREGVRHCNPIYPLEQGLELKSICDRLIVTRTKVLRLIDTLESSSFAIHGAALFRTRLLTPFDDRPFDVPFSDDQLQLLSALKPRASEAICIADDTL